MGGRELKEEVRTTNGTGAARPQRRWTTAAAVGALALALTALLPAAELGAQQMEPEVEQPAGEQGSMAEDEMGVGGAAEADAAEEAQPAAPEPYRCDGPEHDQFDFWLGEWEVHEWGGERSESPAINRITKSLDGCTVREEYEHGRYAGASLNFYDRFDGRWHQTWIDNGGTPLYLVGGLEDGKMVLSDSPDDGRPWSRITWTPQDDGTVRQTWEVSRDGGETWSAQFDGHYVPRE